MTKRELLQALANLPDDAEIMMDLGDLVHIDEVGTIAAKAIIFDEQIGIIRPANSVIQDHVGYKVELVCIRDPA